MQLQARPIPKRALHRYSRRVLVTFIEPSWINEPLARDDIEPPVIDWRAWIKSERERKMELVKTLPVNVTKGRGAGSSVVDISAIKAILTPDVVAKSLTTGFARINPEDYTGSVGGLKTALEEYFGELGFKAHYGVTHAQTAPVSVDAITGRAVKDTARWNRLATMISSEDATDEQIEQARAELATMIPKGTVFVRVERLVASVAAPQAESK